MSVLSRSVGRLYRWFSEQLAFIDRERRDVETVPDRKTWIVLMTSLLVLCGLEYWVVDGVLSDWMKSVARDDLGWADGVALEVANDRIHLVDQCTWAWGCIVLYGLIPALIVRFVLKERLSDYGWTLRGLGPLWLGMLLVFVPMAIGVVWASGQGSFQATYPFYRSPSSWQFLLIWELSYALQFVALEFFFRGFMIHGLKQRFGSAALWLMVIPYCMIHFPKPAPEAVGSIFAGLFLGIISLRFGSIFLGVVLHVSIAWLMDALSLWRQGWLSAIF